MSIRTLALTATLLTLSPFAAAQGGLEDLLGVHKSGGATSASSVFKSTAGEWHLTRPEDGKVLGCAVSFVARSGGFVLVGPTEDGSKGTLLFIGAKVDAVNALTETRVALITDKDPPSHRATPMKAFQLPGSQGAVAIATDMAATLRGIADVKRVSLKQREDLILDLSLDGMFPARDALAQCMGMPRIGTAR